MAESPISIVDGLIHPSFNHRSGSNHEICEWEEALAKKWDDRVDELTDQNGLLVYFSSFESLEKSPVTEKDRVAKFQERLGLRMLYYPFPMRVAEARPSDEIARRGYKLNPKRLRVTAYGLYLNECVNEFGLALARDFRVSPYHFHKDPALSLRRI